LAESAPAAWDVRALLDGAREVRLFHGKEEYRLRLTRNNKLILTK
jgi:hemin uptake protein HemP